MAKKSAAKKAAKKSAVKKAAKKSAVKKAAKKSAVKKADPQPETKPELLTKSAAKEHLKNTADEKNSVLEKLGAKDISYTDKGAYVSYGTHAKFLTTDELEKSLQ